MTRKLWVVAGLMLGMVPAAATQTWTVDTTVDRVTDERRVGALLREVTPEAGRRAGTEVGLGVWCAGNVEVLTLLTSTVPPEVQGFGLQTYALVHVRFDSAKADRFVADREDDGLALDWGQKVFKRFVAARRVLVRFRTLDDETVTSEFLLPDGTAQVIGAVLGACGKSLKGDAPAAGWRRR